ncbi:2-oxoacid:acceptor oxidoreductase family protein [Clostridiaceae bacterium OttesenSCG-928-D20]|nr:2-oxoacid:acceptor oxidoreductase family protein [Clostridiaceae bacterium OttesenSCG-928-D20]
MLEQNLFAGFGGQGMLLIGQFLAEAGMLENKKVSWLPSYGPEMRGGTANCSVCVSDKDIASPVITKASCVIAMNRPSLDKFEKFVRPGGLLLVNSSLIDVKATRDDINVCYVPANELAEKLGNSKVANVVMLGAYLEKSKCVSIDSLLQVIATKLGAKKAHLVEINKKALVAGAEAAK